MPVKKRKASPYWWYDFTLQGDRFRGSTGIPAKASKRRLAQAVEDRERERRLLGTPDRKAPMTLDQALGRYWLEVAAYQASADMTERQAKMLLDRIGPATLLTDLDGDAIGRYIARRRGDRVGNTKTRIGNATVNRDIELLRRLLRRAQTTWKLAVAEVDWPGLLLVESAGRTRSLSLAEERRLFAALRPDYWPLVLFAMLTGLRKAALVSLTWQQVDLEAGVIHFRLKSKQPGGRPHTLPLTGPMAAILQVARGHHPERVFTYVCRKTRRIPAQGVNQQQGQRYPFTANGFGKDWRAALNAAAIDDFVFHDLRHTAATRMLALTGNLKGVKDLLAHADLTSTMRYAHLEQSTLRRLMEETHQASAQIRHITEQPIDQPIEKKAQKQ